MSHTPGPWRVLNHGDSTGVVGPDGTFIFEDVYDWHSLGQDNAALIAAAPEMYDVLKTALKFHEAPGHGLWLSPGQWAAIRAVIAKAGVA